MTTPTDRDLTDLAVEFLLAMMSSASTDVIRPLDWWERARAALETSAAVAESWPQMVAKFGQKIQVTATRAKTSSRLSSIGQQLADEAVFERFRYLAQRDALYVAAMAQARRDEEKDVVREDRKHYGERALEAEEAIRLVRYELERAKNRIAELEEDNRVLRQAHAATIED